MKRFHGIVALGIGSLVAVVAAAVHHSQGAPQVDRPGHRIGYRVGVLNAVGGRLEFPEGGPIVVVVEPRVDGSRWPDDVYFTPAVNVWKFRDEGGYDYIGYFVSETGGYRVKAHEVSSGADAIHLPALAAGRYRALVTLHFPNEPPGESPSDPDVDSTPMESEVDLGGYKGAIGVNLIVR